MKKTSLCIIVLFVAVAAIACGGPPDEVASPPAGGGASLGDPGSPTTMTPEPDTGLPDMGGRPERVRPRPGMADLRPVPWERARQTPDGRHLRIVYWSGVEPCNVLDHVEIDYGSDEVTVTLYEGSDPEQPDAVCIEIALRKVVRVALEEPVDGRQVVDGAE